MHYERTCQGVYNCPKNGEDSEPCEVKSCRLRFHTCEKHDLKLVKSPKCKFKLHFYVPIDNNDHRRILLCLGHHNHQQFTKTAKDLEEELNFEKKNLVHHNRTQIQVNNDNSSFQKIVPNIKYRYSKMQATSPQQQQLQSSFTFSPNQNSREDTKVNNISNIINTNNNMIKKIMKPSHDLKINFNHSLKSLNERSIAKFCYNVTPDIVLLNRNNNNTNNNNNNTNSNKLVCPNFN